MKNPYRLPDPPRKSQKVEQQQERVITYEEYLQAKGELEELQKKYGIEPENKEGPISRAISNFFDRRENRKKVQVNKKKDIWLCILLGWAGGHRFYQKQYLLGILYLATCWTGYSVAMSIIDLLIICPMKPDENGNILI